MSETPTHNPEPEDRLPFVDYDEIDARAQNPDHKNLLLDAAFARVIQEHIPDEASDAEKQWARDNAQHAKQVLYEFEANGYQLPVAPDNPDPT